MFWFLFFTSSHSNSLSRTESYARHNICIDTHRQGHAAHVHIHIHQGTNTETSLPPVSWVNSSSMLDCLCCLSSPPSPSNKNIERKQWNISTGRPERMHLTVGDLVVSQYAGSSCIQQDSEITAVRKMWTFYILASMHILFSGDVRWEAFYQSQTCINRQHFATFWWGEVFGPMLSSSKHLLAVAAYKLYTDQSQIFVAELLLSDIATFIQGLQFGFRWLAAVFQRIRRAFWISLHVYIMTKRGS